MSKLFGYKTYNFADKDPIIDALRTAIDSRNLHWSEVAEMSGVSPTTLYNWFQGETRRPMFCTAIAVAKAVGLKSLPIGKARLKL